MNAEKIVIERQYRATLAEVWTLWTTKDGIESWWGPDGFSVAVTALDLRAGGIFDYVMTATGEGQIAFMKAAGMPVSTPARITFTEVTPMTRLVYKSLVDFAPGITPYDVGTVVALTEVPDGVHVVLTFDPMHDEGWSEQMVAGWREQLEKLEGVLGA